MAATAAQTAEHGARDIDLAAAGRETRDAAVPRRRQQNPRAVRVGAHEHVSARARRREAVRHPAKVNALVRAERSCRRGG